MEDFLTVEYVSAYIIVSFFIVVASCKFVDRKRIEGKPCSGSDLVDIFSRGLAVRGGGRGPTYYEDSTNGDAFWGMIRILFYMTVWPVAFSAIILFFICKYIICILSFLLEIIFN